MNDLAPWLVVMAGLVILAFCVAFLLIAAAHWWRWR